MRRLLAFLLVLAPFGAPSAAVTINGHMGAPVGDVSCASASSISYDLDENVFAFHCGTNALNYSCTPSGVEYATGTQIIELNCQTNTGAATGLVVNAMIDGVQNGNGNSDGFCNNAENFKFELAKGKYTWTCNNGVGNTKEVACWTSAETSALDLAVNQFNMDCVTIFSRSGFEDFETKPDGPPPQL